MTGGWLSDAGEEGSAVREARPAAPRTTPGAWGILGGTFDPIHYAHLAIAEQARETLELAGVLFVPAGMPPHKTDRAVTAPSHRVAMVELAIADNPWFRLCRVEVDRPGRSYAVDTVQGLLAEPPEPFDPAAGFVFVAGAAIRLARFNIQTGTVDKRYFVGLPSPAAAAVPATTIYFYPEGLQSPLAALAVLALVIVPGLLMVSTFRFYSFKTLDLQSRRAYPVLALLALGLALLTAHEIMLVVIAYAYLISGPIMWAWSRLRRHHHEEHDDDVVTTKVTKNTKI